MKFRFFSPAFFALTLISTNLNAQPGIVIDSAVGQTGQVVCVPVRAKGFDVNSMWGSISWDPQVLDYNMTQNYLLVAMGDYSFNFNSQTDKLLFFWVDPAALCVSVDDGEVLFEMCFSVIGPAGSSSNIKIDTAEIINCDGQDIWPYVGPPALFWVTTATNAPELGFSKQLTFTLSPNPTSSSARVTVQSQKENEAKLFVTNTLGKIVFEQKASIKTGENQIQIPAEILKTAGIYQVLLQTEQDAISRLLIVN